MIVTNRPMSITSIRDYRAGVKNDANLDIEILKLKINCLIDSSEHVSYTVCGKRYLFGSCKIEVDRENRIRSISWLRERKFPSKRELLLLQKAYLSCGLDKKGKRYLTEKEKKDAEIKYAYEEMYV